MIKNILKKTSMLTQIEKEIIDDTKNKIIFPKNSFLYYVIGSNNLVLFPIEEKKIKDIKGEFNNVSKDIISSINILFNIIHSIKLKTNKISFKNYIKEIKIPSIRRSVGKDEKGGNPNYIKKTIDKLYIIPNWDFGKIGITGDFKQNEEILFIKGYEIDISLFSNQRISRSLYKLVHINENGYNKQELMEKFSIYKEIILFELFK